MQRLPIEKHAIEQRSQTGRLGPPLACGGPVNANHPGRLQLTEDRIAVQQGVRRTFGHCERDRRKRKVLAY